MLTILLEVNAAVCELRLRTKEGCGTTKRDPFQLHFSLAWKNMGLIARLLDSLQRKVKILSLGCKKVLESSLRISR